jgi:hypothetical protein
MRRSSVGLSLFLILLVAIQVVAVTDANPTWGKPATPTPPIKDPPQIIINSPNIEAYNNTVPLNITIIQPDSWVTQQSMNSTSIWVVGPNTLRSITCIVDGQSLILWNGTRGYQNWGVTYYLPKVSQFSAVMNVSKGQHNLQVNVLAVSEYSTEGIIPFANKEYLISANQSTTFNVKNGPDATWSPTIDNKKSPYVPFNPEVYSVTVNSLLPKNQFYFPNNLTLDLQVNDIPSIPTRQVAGEIRVSVDDNQSYAHLGIDVFNFSSSIQELNYSIPLTLPEGNHTLTARISLIQTPFGNFTIENPIPDIAVYGTSLPINIQVDSTKSQTTLTPNPSFATNEPLKFQNQPIFIVLISAIVVAVLAIAAVLYQRKNKVRDSHD